MEKHAPFPNSNPSSNPTQIPQSVPIEMPDGEPIPLAPAKGLFKNKISHGFQESTGFHSGPVSKRSRYQIIFWSWTAGFIDLLLCAGLCCIFLTVFSLLMDLPISQIIKQTGSSLTEIWGYAFLCFTAIYLMVSRSFLGFSLGEWTCQLRIGSPKERLLKDYSIRVVLRTLLIICTGFLTLPLLSLLFGRDLAGKFSGVHVISLK
jgi:hypothetical protein